MDTDPENPAHSVTREEILLELRKLKSESLLKDALLAIIPLVVAGLSIYYSHKNSREQLAFSNEQQKQNNVYQNTRQLAELSDNIIQGGPGAEIAYFALKKIGFTEVELRQITALRESESGQSDAPNEIDVSGKDNLFGILLNQLYDPEKSARAEAYGLVRRFLENNYSDDLVKQMFEQVKREPLNIYGRSNVLSILAASPSKLIQSNKNTIIAEIGAIESLAELGPAYAVGPMTNNWINDIREKLE